MENIAQMFRLTSCLIFNVFLRQTSRLAAKFPEPHMNAAIPAIYPASKCLAGQIIQDRWH